MKKSQKISSKIDFIGTCLNSLESLEGTLGLLGVKFDFFLEIHSRLILLQIWWYWNLNFFMNDIFRIFANEFGNLDENFYTSL